MRIDDKWPAPPRRHAAPRWMGWLALLLLVATLLSGSAVFRLFKDAGDRQANERHSVIASTVENYRLMGLDSKLDDPEVMRRLERAAGVNDLRFEQEPELANRAVQSVLDDNGRIVGWLSWAPDQTSGRMLVLLAAILLAMAIGIAGFAAVSLWQVRRSVKALTASEQRAWALAHRDPLTGLPNHAKLMDMIDAALAAALSDTAETKPVMLAFADIDGLTGVNESLGHPAGDALLAAWAGRLCELLPGDAACGRFDGDQFAIVLHCADKTEAMALLGSLAARLSEPYLFGERLVQVDCSIGIAHGETRDDLVRRADLALRHAKRTQRGGIVAFRPEMENELAERRFIEQELRRALITNALDVHYQPIVSSDGASIVGAEALLRWTHPVRGAIGPSVFVPVAEACGLMGRLGDFVLRRALEDAHRWPSLTIAVNLSPVQVRDRALVEHIDTLLKQTGIAPHRLELEVTEGVLIDNPDEAQERLDALHALGVKLSLDDFGTGYSGLTYLQRFRFDKLKIDRGFVAPLGQTAEAQAMVQAIVAMGRALGLTTLAEGVETEEQRILLRLAGCEEMQGYLFAKPAPRETLDRWLTERPERPAARTA